MFQEQLYHSQKLEAVGQLAGGMAHDFNNMLAVIMGNAELALYDLKPGAPGHEEMNEILKASARAKELTMRILTFARKEKLNVRPVGINGIVKELVPILKRSFSKNIRIKTFVQEGLPPVGADANQLHQALLNICNNARDAMPGGGELIIETSLAALDDEYCRLHPDVRPGEYCLVRVSDTGVGMPEEIKYRIFEPFFTTKGAEKGTGLGLSVTYGIIRNHGGHIRVYTEPGKGTAMHVYLPVSPQVGAEGGIGESGEIRGGSETILVVDDETALLGLAEKILSKAGYKVLTAARGREAVELYRSRPGEIDLVILDMIMPEMDGGTVYRMLKEINPEVAALLSSGYSINGQAGALLSEGIRGFVQKPFSFNELRRAVRDALDAE